MTEDEAKTKWCAHAVASHTNPRMGFDDDKMPKVHVCIGSACMAWRWLTTPEQAAHSDGIAKASGFCGLAGKP